MGIQTFGTLAGSTCLLTRCASASCRGNCGSSNSTTSPPALVIYMGFAARNRHALQSSCLVQWQPATALEDVLRVTSARAVRRSCFCHLRRAPRPSVDHGPWPCCPRHALHLFATFDLAPLLFPFLCLGPPPSFRHLPAPCPCLFSCPCLLHPCPCSCSCFACLLFPFPCAAPLLDFCRDVFCRDHCHCCCCGRAAAAAALPPHRPAANVAGT